MASVIESGSHRNPQQYRLHVTPDPVFSDAGAKAVMDDIRAIKGLVPVPHDWWWLVLLAGLVATAIALYLWRRRKTAPVDELVPPLSAVEIALAALRRLREDSPPVEVFYTRLSDIVRRYLEDKFQLRAPERTTEEFLVEVSRDGALLPEHQTLLSAFLQESDLVKFARHRPGKDDMERVFGAAENFVRDTQI
jgi:hypothetical protein